VFRVYVKTGRKIKLAEFYLQSTLEALILTTYMIEK